MLWHRQAIFESKGDKLSSSAECRIRTQGLRHLFASRLNACWQTDWAIEDQAKNLTSTARPYDQQAFSPLDLTASWLSHLALAICMFLLISMLWHRQAIFESKGDKLSSSAECRIRIQGLRHLFASRLNACWQTDWAIEDQAKNLNSTARPYDQQAFSPLDLTDSWLWHLARRYACLLLISMLWHRQAIFESKGDKLSSSAECRIRTQGLRHLFASRLNACWQTDWAIKRLAITQNPVRFAEWCVHTMDFVNSLAPWRCGCDVKCLILERNLVIDILNISSGIVLRCMPANHIDGKSK